MKFKRFGYYEKMPEAHVLTSSELLTQYDGTYAHGHIAVRVHLDRQGNPVEIKNRCVA